MLPYVLNIPANRPRQIDLDNYDRFCSFTSDIPWTDLLKDCDAIESWEILKMQKCMEKFIPIQSACYVTNKPLWMTYRAFKAKYKKYLYWKTFKESKLHADYETYKQYQNRAVAEIHKAKKSFEKKLADI